MDQIWGARQILRPTCRKKAIVWAVGETRTWNTHVFRRFAAPSERPRKGRSLTMNPKCSVADTWEREDGLQTVGIPNRSRRYLPASTTRPRRIERRDLKQAAASRNHRLFRMELGSWFGGGPAINGRVVFWGPQSRHAEDKRDQRTIRPSAKKENTEAILKMGSTPNLQRTGIRFAGPGEFSMAEHSGRRPHAIVIAMLPGPPPPGTAAILERWLPAISKGAKAFHDPRRQALTFDRVGHGF